MLELELFTVPPPDTYPVLGPALLARRAVSTVKMGARRWGGHWGISTRLSRESNRLNEDMARGYPRLG